MTAKERIKEFRDGKCQCWNCTVKMVEDAERDATEKERERCAKVAENVSGWDTAKKCIAAAIRGSEGG